MVMFKEDFTILIVDDEKNNITVLAQILMPAYTVLVAKDGPSAIDLAQHKKPDLILLDIIMPGMSGFEVLTTLKNSDLTMHIPVIFITGLDNLQDEEKGLLLGAVDYITKPFHNSIVKLRVETHLKILSQLRMIEQLGMLDALTNIPNRRSYDHYLSVEWNRAFRSQTAISILMIDIDHFKNFNDTYGHAHGDKVLKAVADVITGSIRRSVDFAARWGGEEFAVLLPDTDVNGAAAVAEQIRLNVENELITCVDGRVTSVTVSIGAHSLIPKADNSIDDFMNEVDQHLYAAKNAGRNRVSTQR